VSLILNGRQIKGRFLISCFLLIDQRNLLLNLFNGSWNRLLYSLLYLNYFLLGILLLNWGLYLLWLLWLFLLFLRFWLMLLYLLLLLMLLLFFNNFLLLFLLFHFDFILSFFFFNFTHFNSSLNHFFFFVNFLPFHLFRLQGHLKSLLNHFFFLQSLKFTHYRLISNWRCFLLGLRSFISYMFCLSRSSSRLTSLHLLSYLLLFFFAYHLQGLLIKFCISLHH
jgi:hypothetical protein